MTYSSESEASEVVESRVSSLVPALSLILEKKKTKEFWDLESLIKSYHCDVTGCTAKFSRPWRLAAHKAFHLGERPFRCTVEGCGRSYTSNYHLRRHKLSAHAAVTNTRKFKCEWAGCDKVFTLIQNAKKHYRRTHCDKSRECPTCKERFFSHLLLKRHTLTAHTLGSGLKCNECKISFEDNYTYSRHMRGHKLHTCPVVGCNFAQSNWSLVRKHIKTHPYGYVCFHCKKGYRQRKFLKLHVIRHLKGDVKERKPYCLKKFTCDICNAELLGKASLRRHKKQIHENPLSTRPAKEKKIRSSRKDKGIPKKSMAGILSDINLPKEVEKELICAEPEIGTVQTSEG